MNPRFSFLRCYIQDSTDCFDHSSLAQVCRPAVAEMDLQLRVRCGVSNLSFNTLLSLAESLE